MLSLSQRFFLQKLPDCLIVCSTTTTTTFLICANKVGRIQPRLSQVEMIGKNEESPKLGEHTLATQCLDTEPTSGGRGRMGVHYCFISR